MAGRPKVPSILESLIGYGSFKKRREHTRHVFWFSWSSSRRGWLKVDKPQHRSTSRRKVGEPAKPAKQGRKSATYIYIISIGAILNSNLSVQGPKPANVQNATVVHKILSEQHRRQGPPSRSI